MLLILNIVLSVHIARAATWEASIVASAPISTRPVICSDSLGHLHAAWTSDDPYGEKLRYATNQSGEWDYQKQVGGSSSDEAYVPLITADQYGFAYIVARFSSSWFRIKYASNKETTDNYWTLTTQMFDAHYHETSIEVDTEQNVHIFAQEDDSWGSNVFYQNHTLDDVVIDGGTSQFYGTTIDQDDVLHFVGSHADNIWYTNNSTGSWSSAIAIDQIAVSAYQPSIACGKNGVLHVVFGSADGIYYLNNESGSWGTPESTGAAGIFPNVVIDENGSAHVAYYTQVENGAIYYLNNIGGSWNTGEYISTINTDASPATEDAAHVRGKIALDLKSSTVNIVYMTDGESVTVSQTDDYELRSTKSTDVTSTLVSNGGAPVTETISINAEGTITLMEFTISDISGDGEPTKIEEFVFQRGSNMSEDICFNDVFQLMSVEAPDKSSTACSVFSSKAIVGTNGSVWQSIPEGGSLSFTLKGTFKDDLTNVTDEIFQIKLNGLYDVIIDESGSYFSYSNSDVCSNMLLFELNDFDGAGTEEDPYLIADIDDLEILSECTAYWDKYLKQTDDIDASSTSGWNSGDGFSPIGDMTVNYIAFTGSYDGDGHILSGLTIDRGSSDYIGLFGYTNGATMQDLGLTSVDITGNNYVAGLIGYNVGSTISKCYTSGSVVAGNYSGGFVGFNLNASTISNSYCTASISTSGARIGGFAGWNWSTSTLEKCYSTGSVSGTSNVGGLVGYNDGTVNNSFYNSTTSGQSDTGKGEPKNTEEMQTQTTFTNEGWDFTDVWAMNGGFNNGYPYLQDVNTLPITLSTFTAQFIENTPTLYWSTQSEVDNLGWFIYRNDDNEFSSSEIISEMIEGHGNSTQQQSYIYQDAVDNLEIGCTYYYWLESIDYSGISQVYSRVAQITIPDPSINPPNIEPPIVYDFKNIPNPISGSAQFQFTLDKSSMVSVSIYNILGELVQTLPQVMTQPDETAHIYWNGKNSNGKELTPGVYFYNLMVNGKKAETKKLILMK